MSPDVLSEFDESRKPEGETTFENAKVGDRVWSNFRGWGEIIEVDDSKPRPLNVMLNGITYWFSRDGKLSHGECQTLFWDEIKFDIPVRPKRKVKVEENVFVRCYETGLRAVRYSDDEFLFRSDGKDPIYPAKLIYEIEE